MVLDTNAGRGPTHLLKFTPKSLSRLRTEQQEVSGTSSKQEGFAQWWTYPLSQHGFQALAMLFYQQSRNTAETASSILPPAHYISMPTKHYATTKRQPIVD